MRIKSIVAIGVSILFVASVLFWVFINKDFIEPECDTTVYKVDTKYTGNLPPTPSNYRCYITAYTDAVVAVTGWGDYDEIFALQVWQITNKGVVINGVLGTHTPIMYRALQNISHKKAFILADIVGSLNDEANIEVGIQLYTDGYTTTIPKNGIVESGGTDFFASGVQRYFYKQSKIGIHSWSIDDKQANDFTKDDPVHALYLDFYKAINIPEKFYWVTLQTPAEDMTYMTVPQVQKYLKATLLP